MVTVRCFCGAVQDFLTSRQAQEAGWWVNPDPGQEPSDFCPVHNTSEFVIEEREDANGPRKVSER